MSVNDENRGTKQETHEQQEAPVTLQPRKDKNCFVSASGLGYQATAEQENEKRTTLADRRFIHSAPSFGFAQVGFSLLVDEACNCLLVGCLMSQQRTMYLRDGSAQTIVRALR